MTNLERFERWVHRARQETAPQPDVCAAVMARLLPALAARRAPGAPAESNVWLWLVSGATAGAAAVCAVLGYGAWTTLSDPWPMWFDQALPGIFNWGVL